ncbi:oxidoreductase [Aspergillus foveolatus]|uniref:oxidoreductase n=1 Tax=Aspergillus foveolatus TaxID=210207 RepID=UPI003CCCEAC5
MHPFKSKSILITGCSANSIGAALAQTLAQHPDNHHIFATARSLSKIPESLASLPNVTVLQLDVTSDQSVTEAVEAVRQHTGADAAASGTNATANTATGAGLDILVNNAGIGYTTPLLDAHIGKARDVYETNVWGVLRMVQGFADLLIARKGRVVNVSTSGAVVNTPWIGIYSSSKSALTLLTETLRLELSPFDVSVVSLMLGTIATSFHANEPAVTLPPSSRYIAIRDTISRWASGEAGPKPGSVTEAAKLLAGDVLGTGTGLVWRGPNAGAVKFVSRWCPGWLVDKLLSTGQGLDELEKSKKSA